MAQAQFARETRSDGSWKRQSSAFRDQVTADGSSGLPAQAGRYHMSVSRACPGAHRAIIMRRLKGPEDAVGMTVVDPVGDDEFARHPEFDCCPSELRKEIDSINEWVYAGIIPGGPAVDWNEEHGRG
jgi:glutathionyl-hydroquinone reductase